MSWNLSDIRNRVPLRRIVPAYQGNLVLTGFVILLVAIAFALLGIQGNFGLLISPVFLLWLIFSIGAELLWLDTITEKATDSMASTFNVAVLYLFCNTLSLWIIGLSVLLATRYIQKRDWFKTAFGFAQMVITAYVAGSVFKLLAGGPATLETFKTVGGIAGLIFCCVAYFITNYGLVAGVISIASKERFWPTLRDNYLYKNTLMSSGTLFLLSPILLLAYLSIGYPGVFLFFLPLVIVRKQNRDYIELQKATQALISSERMAAKGEMAASVAHEMNNYLAVLTGRTQLLQRKIQKKGLEEFVKDGEVLWTQIGRLTTLAKGLLDFSGGQPKVTQFDLNAMCRETVEFLSPQNLFDKVDMELDLEPRMGVVEADQGQLQQVLMNLIRNAAQAMRDAGTENREIIVRTCLDPKGYARFEVLDNGPGIPEDKRNKVFEPGFTTKKDGHGFGLATCFRILENHKGRIWVEERSGGGTHFLVAVPHEKAREKKAA